MCFFLCESAFFLADMAGAFFCADALGNCAAGAGFPAEAAVQAAGVFKAGGGQWQGCEDFAYKHPAAAVGGDKQAVAPLYTQAGLYGHIHLVHGGGVHKRDKAVAGIFPPPGLTYRFKLHHNNCVIIPDAAVCTDVSAKSTFVVVWKNHGHRPCTVVRDTPPAADRQYV